MMYETLGQAEKRSDLRKIKGERERRKKERKKTGYKKSNKNFYFTRDNRVWQKEKMKDFK